jgi:small GTP-binding protein
MPNVKEIQKKIILLGDGAVGKTSLIKRFVVDKFDDKYILTIGSKITAKALQIEIEKDLYYLNLQIWDILGQKGYTKLHESSFRGTDGVMMVADITRHETLESLGNYWIPEVENLIGIVPFVILINKSDLKKQADIKERDVKKLALRFKSSFYFTSAKNGENVKLAFNSIGKGMIENKGIGNRRPTKPGEIGGVPEKIIIIDRIIDDFCEVYGNLEDAMPIVRKQFDIAELDLNNPSKEALRLAIERLAMVEKDFKEWEVAEENRIKRLKWLKEINYW